MLALGPYLDIDHIITGAENAVRIEALLPVEVAVGDDFVIAKIYADLSRFGASILGRAGLLVIMGDQFIGNDNSGNYPISGNDMRLAGRYRQIASVFMEQPIKLPGGIETQAVPALEIDVTNLPLGDDGKPNGQLLHFPRVAVPLLGQRPKVYQCAS